MALALASAVPVNTDHGAASPQPVMPALVVILTIAPGIDWPISPTPCRRRILSGQRTTSTATPAMLSSLMTKHPTTPNPPRALGVTLTCRRRHVQSACCLHEGPD